MYLCPAADGVSVVSYILYISVIIASNISSFINSASSGSLNKCGQFTDVRKKLHMLGSTLVLRAAYSIHIFYLAFGTVAGLVICIADLSFPNNFVENSSKTLRNSSLSTAFCNSSAYCLTWSVLVVLTANSFRSGTDSIALRTIAVTKVKCACVTYNLLRHRNEDCRTVVKRVTYPY